MPARRSKITSAWRCEDTKGEGWSSRLYRDLIGVGKQPSCKQHVCTGMKERLDRHRKNCPASIKKEGREKGSADKSPVNHTMDQASSAIKSHALSVGAPSQESPLIIESKMNTVQTNLTFADFASIDKHDHYDVRSAQTNLTFTDDLSPLLKKSAENEQNRIIDKNPIKLNETREVPNNHAEDITPVKNNDTQILAGQNSYRDQLNNELQEFFHDIPVFPNTSETIKLRRLTVINNFVGRISDLFVFINKEDYYDKVELEIDECLSDLPMWLPQSEPEKKEFRNCINDSLFKFIKTFNEKWYNVNKGKKYIEKYPKRCVSHNNNGNCNLEKEIINWVQTKVHNSVKKDFITHTLIQEIKRILKSGINEKPLLKAELVHVLEDLAPYFDFSRNKDLCVDVLASDLTNHLKGLEDKYMTDDNNISDDCTRDVVVNNAISQITEILFSNDDLTSLNKNDVITDIRRVLKSSVEFTDSEASCLAKTLVTNLRDFLHRDFYARMDKSRHSGSFLVLTSEQDLSMQSGPKFHSTLRTDVPYKDISKLNKAEKLLIKKVSAIIRSWLDTTDLTFDTMEDQIFKETIVDDITNDVYSIVKQSIQSQEPRARIDEGFLNSAIMQGIQKYELFTNPVTEKSPQVVDLRRRIMALNADDVLNASALLEPQHGSRQGMANAKFSKINDMKNRQGLLYQPKALDILEDNISVWMNEQPSEIYTINDKPTRNRLLREIASKVQDKMISKMPENEIKNELVQWLSKIVKPQIKNVDGLAENLKDKIMKLPQDETLTRAHEKRLNDAPLKFAPEQHSYKSEDDVKLDEYIDKYVQHNYDNVDDDVINGVLKLMLKHELYKRSPSVREELYNNVVNDEFNTDEFRMELEIVQQVYEWLKDIPFYYRTLKPGSEIIEFVHSLAKNIVDIETERINYPDRMNYNSWLHTEIAMFMLQKEAAIANYEDKIKIDSCAAQLCLRIFNLRKRDEGASDELYKIVTEHMRKYDSLLSKDYLKKILWHRRLADSVKKLLLGKPTASRADVENVLETIPFPRDESVFKYKMEIKYNITIHDWLHALPLVPISSNEGEIERKKWIQELLQKILETDQRKSDNPHDSQADDDLDNYLAYWISQLPFEKKNVDVPMLISQLRSGLEYVKWAEIQPQRPPDVNVQRMNKSRRHSKSHTSKQKDPGEQMVEVIEDWCSKLPLKEDNDEATKAAKEQVATNIFQIVGSHIDDPRIADDNQKLRNVLDSEIEVELQNLSKHDAIKENKDSLKDDLLDNVMKIRNTIRDITAGDDYVHALENSIDESLGNRRQRSSNKNDPGYELFKKKTVMFWLLENYDYAVDFHSLKYKKILSEEIRSLSDEVQKRNHFPTDKDEMMNDIMSAFYDAKPPNEDAIIDEIENIKLRCEIEVWANELPLKEPVNYTSLLEHDQILTMLTKILYDIERSEAPDADETMRTETVKWASKLPLITGEKSNLPKYADLLMCFLKASSDSRKCRRQPEPKNITAVEETLSKLKSGDDLGGNNQEHFTTQVAGPSASVNFNLEGVSGEQLTSLITKAIYNWCTQLPLQFESADEQNAVQRMKELIAQRLLHFVGELHYRPNTLRNEGLYEYYLNNKLETILLQLTNDRLYWEAQQGRNERKNQLINALKAIRPLIQDVKDQEQYKEQLKHTISSFHESMIPHSSVGLSRNTQLAILDDFIQYKNHKGDFESQELYKLKINDTLNSELNGDNDVDPLLAANRLICELSKVECPIIHSERDVAHTRRRFSQPNPLEDIDRLPSTPSLRRHSLPHPLLHSSCPRFAPTRDFIPLRQRNLSYPGPGSQTPSKSTPLSTSLPSRIASQRPPVPVLPRAPRMSRSPLIGPQEHIPPPSFSPFPSSSRFDMRPFPLPLPVFNHTDESNTQSARREPQNQIQYRQPEPGLVESLIVPRNEQQSMPSGAGAGSRTTARAPHSRRSLTECPEEQLHRDRVRPASGLEYCETCERNDDCVHNMRPYPTPMDYMYY